MKTSIATNGAATAAANKRFTDLLIKNSSVSS